MAQVDLGKVISGKELEGILLEAAKDIGLETKSEGIYGTRYKLGSVHKIQTYDGTSIMLKKGESNIADMRMNKNEDLDFFFIYEKDGQEALIEEYLNAVSKRI